MKDPHNSTKYVQVDKKDDEPTPNASDAPDAESPADGQVPPPEQNGKTKKPKFSGAYYYVDKDEQKLATASFARTTLTIIAFMLQVVALLFPEQAGAIYVSKHIASYGLIYVLFTVFGLVGVSIWLMITNQFVYKIAKRIPVERAPKHGFTRRAFFGQELYIAVNAAMSVFQLSFVCIRFDGWGLGAFFVCLAALAAAVAARQVTHLTLKDAELIPAPDGEAIEKDDGSAE